MTEIAYDLYGSKSLGLDELRLSVENVFGVKFLERYSDYMGGDYFRFGEFEGEEFIIQLNWIDEDDREFLEPNHSEYPVLLKVDATDRGDEIRNALSRIVDLDFLERKT